MAKNNKKDKKQEVKFVNPAKRVWGKILIAFLAIAMALGSLITVIYLIATNITSV